MEFYWHRILENKLVWNISGLELYLFGMLVLRNVGSSECFWYLEMFGSS